MGDTEEELASVVGGNGSRCRRGMVWSSYRNRCVRSLVDTEEELASVVGGNGSRCRRGMVWSSYRNRCVRTLVDTEETVGCPMFRCMMYCPHGFETDANGCDVCMCARAEWAVG